MVLEEWFDSGVRHDRHAPQRYGAPMLGLIGAMPEEIETLLAEMHGECEHVERGGRLFHVGTLWGRPVVAVLSRVGKVAAATTATLLIDRFNVDELILTGVAGAIDRDLRLGDVVVADRLAQHDIDASPIFPRYEVPLLGATWFETDGELQAELFQAAGMFVDHDLDATIDGAVLHELGVDTPRVRVGGIVSGEQFIKSADVAERIARDLPGTLCVEMEGAAVAQICREFGARFGVVRAISDSADHTAADDFLRSLPRFAAAYTHGILRRLIGARNAILT